MDIKVSNVEEYNRSNSYSMNFFFLPKIFRIFFISLKILNKRLRRTVFTAPSAIEHFE